MATDDTPVADADHHAPRDLQGFIRVHPDGQADVRADQGARTDRDQALAEHRAGREGDAAAVTHGGEAAAPGIVGTDGSDHACQSPRLVDRVGRDAPGPPAEAFPGSLPEALSALEQDEVMRSWLPADLLRTYLSVKRSEISAVADLPADQVQARYARAY